MDFKLRPEVHVSPNVDFEVRFEAHMSPAMDFQLRPEAHVSPNVDFEVPLKWLALGTPAKPEPMNTENGTGRAEELNIRSWDRRGTHGVPWGGSGLRVVATSQIRVVTRPPGSCGEGRRGSELTGSCHLP